MKSVLTDTGGVKSGESAELFALAFSRAQADDPQRRDCTGDIGIGRKVRKHQIVTAVGFST